MSFPPFHLSTCAPSAILTHFFPFFMLAAYNFVSGYRIPSASTESFTTQHNISHSLLLCKHLDRQALSSCFNLSHKPVLKVQQRSELFYVNCLQFVNINLQYSDLWITGSSLYWQGTTIFFSVSNQLLICCILLITLNSTSVFFLQFHYTPSIILCGKQHQTQLDSLVYEQQR